MKRIALCVFTVFFLGVWAAPVLDSPGVWANTPAAGTEVSAPSEGAPALSYSGERGCMNALVETLGIDRAGREDVIRVFGEPQRYVWGDTIFDAEHLPATYVMSYFNGFCVCMSDGQVEELRFSHNPLYVYRDITIGSGVDEVFAALGEPDTTVENADVLIYTPGVFYKDRSGQKGSHYYQPTGYPVRMFFRSDKVQALYLMRSDDVRQPETAVSEVNPYDDIRKLDISKVDFTGRDDLIKTLWFSQNTRWPASALALDWNPERVLEAAKNPGLGVRSLHERGITGDGINVAIIDQPMYLDHPEFAGKIAAYKDFGCGTESSMHGPAVTSLLVGSTTGTAPDAELYYAAVPSWKADAAYYADALTWIVEENGKLPEGDKIRVVSVSVAPSGFTMNNEMWDEAVARAEADGILVLDCTEEHGFIWPCYYDLEDLDDISKCQPGFPGGDGMRPARDGNILVPTSPRTTAEEYEEGAFGYQYTGRGGLSWAIPYCTGVLAMGWQVRPELSGEEAKAILLDTAYDKDGYKIIDPAAFIEVLNRHAE